MNDSVSDEILLKTADPVLRAYYADRKLMWRNIALISLCSLGWQKAMQITAPLMILRLLDVGVTEGYQAAAGTVNMWLVSFLVMYFSWRSDHTVAKMGRRKPYLFIAAGPIILATALFPLIGYAPLLFGLWCSKMLFMDMKQSTFPLLNIDCVVRSMLARAQSILGVVSGLTGFFAMQYTPKRLEMGEWVPYAVGAGLLTFSTACAWFIKEPPIHHPKTESFKPWSAIKIGLTDRTLLWLMMGAAMIASFELCYTKWVWIWSKTVLHIDRSEVFSTLSWVALLNVALAFPIGWLIDKIGGYRVVLMYFAGMMICCGIALWVHDVRSLLVMAIALAFVAPLNSAADIMIYKRAVPKDVGSVTSTYSFFRNFYNGLFYGATGLIITLANRNYHAVYIFGAVMTAIGLALLLIYHRKALAASHAPVEIQG